MAPLEILSELELELVAEALSLAEVLIRAEEFAEDEAAAGPFKVPEALALFEESNLVELTEDNSAEM